MTSLSRIKQSALLGVASLALVAISTTAMAQTSQSAGKDVEEVIVTGTNIRGVAPVGANVVSVSREDIQASGAVDAVQLLNSLVPQSNDFMQVEQIGRGSNLAGARSPLMRPSLRNLGDENSSTGSPTLVMMDGHRIVPMGILQSTTDIGIIPPGLIDRQEMVLDGTSAIYGSDAVAGTLNYIMRKRVDQTEANVQTGFASDYYQLSVDVTSGAKWDTGGIGLTYSFGKNSNIANSERSYAIPHNYLLPGHPLTGTACDGYSTVTASGQSFTVPGFGAAVPCPAASYFGDLNAAQERNSGVVTLSQDLGERVKFDMTAFYSSRQINQNYGTFTSSATVRPTNPYFTPIPSLTAAQQATQTVSFSWAPVFGNRGSYELNSLKVGQVSPTVTVDIGGGWQSRTLFSYGKSSLKLDQQTLDSTRVLGLAAGTTAATAIDPYNIALTSSSLFPGLVYDNHQEGIHTFTQVREVADGPLFAMSGGDVRAAIGGEWTKTSLKTNLTDAVSHLVQPYNHTSQNDASVFGEINAPFVGPHNSRPGLEALTLSVSARYDHYNDFGNTFDPKIALTYQPLDWVTTRANWGKSFRAPNVADKLGVLNSVLSCTATNVGGCTSFPATPLPGQVLSPGTNVVMSVSGTVPGLTPEKSKNWSVGADISPPFISGLTVSATFWTIHFTNAISIPPTNTTQAYTGGLANLFIVNPTAAQINALAATVPNGFVTANTVINNNYNVLYIYDDRNRNLSKRNLNGLDFSTHYTRPTSFGSLDAAFNGTWQLKNITALSANTSFLDAIATGTPHFRMTTIVGANVGDFRAQATWQHQSGYAILPSATQCTCQTAIDQFDLFNLALRYNVNGNGPWTKDMQLTLSVDNLFDANPPISKTSAGTTTNGSTLGRLITFGIDKKF